MTLTSTENTLITAFGGTGLALIGVFGTMFYNYVVAERTRKMDVYKLVYPKAVEMVQQMAKLMATANMATRAVKFDDGVSVNRAENALSDLSTYKLEYEWLLPEHIEDEFSGYITELEIAISQNRDSTDQNYNLRALLDAHNLVMQSLRKMIATDKIDEILRSYRP